MKPIERTIASLHMMYKDGHDILWDVMERVAILLARLTIRCRRVNN